MVQQRLPSLREVPLAFAHRGARAHAPENTIEAFQLGLRLGANGLESDVWRTADGVAVLDHDGVVRRGLRNTRIADVVRGDLPAHIPSVGEFFAAVGTKFDFSLDVKDPAAIGPLADAVDASDFPLSRLWLCSPDVAVLGACLERMSGAHLVHSTRLRSVPGTFEQHCARLAGSGIDTVNLHHTEWNGGRAVMCHRFGLNAFGWDIQQPEDMSNSLRMGLDGVYSDHVDMMVDVYQSTIGAVAGPD